MQITTERLLLREFTEEDLSDFTLLMADPQVMEFSLKGTLSKEEAREYLQKRILSHYQKYGFGLWAIFIQETGQFIGLAGPITVMIDGLEEVEVGYRFAPKYWGKGFATEAVQVIINYLFSSLPLQKLIAIIDPRNHRSLKVAGRAGMHFWKKTCFHGFNVEIYAIHK